MSTTIQAQIAGYSRDESAIIAIAKTALAKYEGDDLGLYTPHTDAWNALDLQGLIERHPAADKTCDGIVEAFDNAFYFGLRLGARIAVNPTRYPEVDDLVAEYRFKKAAKEAA